MDIKTTASKKPSEYPGAARSEGTAGGTQGIRRVAAVLRLLAAHRDHGLRFTEVADLCGLERPTAHRMLKALLDEELVVRDPGTRRYQLGALVFELGLAAAPQFNLQAASAPSLQRLADQSGDTAFLFVRRGNDAYCVSRIQGSFPIQTPVVPVGSRQPLGVNAGGLAILSALPEREVDEVLRGIRDRLAAFGNLEEDSLRDSLALARAQGHAFIGERAVPGVAAVGLPVLNRMGTPVAALTVASTADRMTPERQRELVPMLQREVDEMVRLLER
jgi:DNA-binding IclR family transcriptional regulator